MTQADDLTYGVHCSVRSEISVLKFYDNIIRRSIVKQYYAKTIHCSGVTAMYTCFSVPQFVRAETCHRVVCTSFW